MLSTKKITLILTGSISAYKSAYLLRELVKAEAKVRVVMTSAACEFITPLTMQTLSGSMVATELFDHYQEAEIGHIDLADNADLILVAPATANILAKAANGIADDLASTILLASKTKKLFVPSMNVNMWENEITQSNVEKLRSIGTEILEPESGELACGWLGAGRLPEIDVILSAVTRSLSPKPLIGKKVLVTAGPTVEPIDPIRFVSNRSSGVMGYEIAKIASALGASVELISGPTNLEQPSGVNFVQVQTAKEMKQAVLSSFKESDFLFMASAVTDHRPASSSNQKVKSDKSSSYQMEMEPCDDILKTVGAIKASKACIIGFCAETGTKQDLIKSAKAKLKNKGCNYIVANLAKDSFSKQRNNVFLLDKSENCTEIALDNKSVIAKKIFDLIL